MGGFDKESINSLYCHACQPQGDKHQPKIYCMPELQSLVFPAHKWLESVVLKHGQWRSMLLIPDNHQSSKSHQPSVAKSTISEMSRSCLNNFNLIKKRGIKTNSHSIFLHFYFLTIIIGDKMCRQLMLEQAAKQRFELLSLRDVLLSGSVKQDLEKLIPGSIFTVILLVLLFFA